MACQNKPMRLLFIPLGMIMFICLGAVYSWSVFRKPIESTFEIGSAQSGLPYMLFLASYAFLMPLGGYLMTRIHPRMVIMIGGLMVGTGWILSGFAPNITLLSLTYGVLAGGGVGLVYGVPMAVAAKWFPEKKGLAVGLTLSGFGVSPFVTAPLARHLIHEFGPFSTFTIMGTAFLIIILVLALPFRFPEASEESLSDKGPAGSSLEADTRAMLRTKEFYGLWICFGISTMVGLMTIGITGPVGEEIAHIEPVHAAWAVAAFSIFNGLGRPLFGWLTDRFGPYKTASLAYLLMALASLFMLLGKEGSVPTYLAAFSLLWLVLGGWLAIAPTTTSIFFGQQHYSRNYGVVFTAYGVGALIGVSSAGLIRDSFGSYLYVFYPVLILGILGMVLSALFLRK